MGGTGRYQVIIGRSTPSVRCLGISHVSFLKFRVSVSTRLKLREVCKYSGSPDAEHRTVRCSSDLYPERFAKPRGHRTQNTGRFNLRPVPSVWCLTLAEPGSLYTGRTGTASDASGPASDECFSAKNTPAASPNFPPAL